MTEQINLFIRLGKGLKGEQRREDYETAAILAGFVRPDDGGLISTWARSVLDKEAAKLKRREK